MVGRLSLSASRLHLEFSISPTIIVTVSPTGETRLETTGFTGPQCKDASRALEAALGLREHEQLTSAFYATQPETTTARQADAAF